MRYNVTPQNPVVQNISWISKVRKPSLIKASRTLSSFVFDFSKYTRIQSCRYGAVLLNKKCCSAILRDEYAQNTFLFVTTYTQFKSPQPYTVYTHLVYPRYSFVICFNITGSYKTHKVIKHLPVKINKT